MAKSHSGPWRIWYWHLWHLPWKYGSCHEFIPMSNLTVTLTGLTLPNNVNFFIWLAKSHSTGPSVGKAHHAAHSRRVALSRRAAPSRQAAPSHHALNLYSPPSLSQKLPFQTALDFTCEEHLISCTEPLIRTDVQGVGSLLDWRTPNPFNFSESWINTHHSKERILCLNRTWFHVCRALKCMYRALHSPVRPEPFIRTYVQGVGGLDRRTPNRCTPNVRFLYKQRMRWLERIAFLTATQRSW